MPSGNADIKAIGFAVTSATIGGTVWVATSGIYCEALAGATITIGERICTYGTAGEIEYCTNANAVIGKALSGASAGQTICLYVTGL